MGQLGSSQASTTKTVTISGLPPAAVPLDVFEGADDEILGINIIDLMQKIRNVEFVYADNHESRNPAQPTNKSNLNVIGDDVPMNLQQLSSDNVREIAQIKKVTGIIWDENSPMAVVDTEVVFEGYTFKKYDIVVKSIGVDHVVFSFKTPDGEMDEITKQLVKEQ